MEENVKDVLDEALEKAITDLQDLDPGSEEFERQAKAVAELDKAKTERRKADDNMKIEERRSDDALNIEKKRFWVNVGQVGATVVTAVVTVFGIVMQWKTNQDVMKYEEDDVITSKAFDNKTKLFKF